nr:C4b-binding protein-like [Lepeophtheirus salmonis]
MFAYSTYGLLICTTFFAQSECSIIRDTLDCPPGYGQSINGDKCVRKIKLNRKKCSEPLIRHGFFDLQLGGRMANFWCEDGRSIVPSNLSHAMCSALGKWDREFPKCILTETGGCGELPEEDHLTAIKLPETDSNEETFTYTFECDPGYSLIGPLVITCDGELWNGTIPGCEKMKEPIPSPIVENFVEEVEEVQTTPPEKTKGFKRSNEPIKKLSEYSLSFGIKSYSSSISLLIFMSSLVYFCP